MLQVKGAYLYENGRPFYWLGDTAWLMFYNLDREEIARYLKNRSMLGYNVILYFCMVRKIKKRQSIKHHTFHTLPFTIRFRFI